MGLNISTDPNQLKKMLFSGAGSNPLYPSPDATASPTAPPASGAIASAMPAPAPLTQTPPSAPPTSQPPQSKEDYLGQHPAILPPRPVGDFDPGTPHPKLRSALAALFAGMAEFGRPGSGMAMANRWADQTAAERAYDTNLPSLRQKAENEQYETYLHGAEQGAGIQHTQAETKNLQQNVPMLQHQQQFLDKVRTLKESGKYSSDEDLFNAMLPEAATIPGMNRQQIVDAINSSKTLGAKYQIQQDKNGRPEFATDRQGNRIFPDAKGKLPDPELQQQWDSISKTHQQGISEEENKEKRVAGYAAERQATALTGHEESQKRETARKEFSKATDEYAAATSAANDMKTFIDLARKGNKLAYAYSPTEGVLTLNTGRGVKRVNMAEIESYGGAGSAMDRIKGFLGKQSSGASIPAGVLNDMEELHGRIADNAKGLYSKKVQGTNEAYGSTFKPMEFKENAPAATGGPQGAQHVPGGKAQGLQEGATGKGSDGKNYVVKGGVWVPR